LDRFEELVTQYEALEKVVEEDRKVRAQEDEEKEILRRKTAAALIVQRWYKRQKRIRDQIVKHVNFRQQPKPP
jgi:hypothetical protein